MRVSARRGDDTATTESVMTKEPSGALSVPVRTLEGVESIALGFRQEMATVGPYEIATGAGWGSDAIVLSGPDGRHAVVRGGEFLKAWVATFDAEDAARFPEPLR
jgi:hypothetical protein